MSDYVTAVTAVAWHVIRKRLDPTEVADLVEDYPDLGQYTWDAVVDRVEELARDFGPADDEYEAAYGHLSSLAGNDA